MSPDVPKAISILPLSFKYFSAFSKKSLRVRYFLSALLLSHMSLGSNHLNGGSKIIRSNFPLTFSNKSLSLTVIREDNLLRLTFALAHSTANGFTSTAVTLDDFEAARID